MLDVCSSFFNIAQCSREQAGEYFCHISNDHGEEVINVTVTVLYKPECKYLIKFGKFTMKKYIKLSFRIIQLLISGTVTYTLMEEEVVLLCTANANPNVNRPLLYSL